MERSQYSPVSNGSFALGRVPPRVLQLVKLHKDAKIRDDLAHSGADTADQCYRCDNSTKVGQGLEYHGPSCSRESLRFYSVLLFTKMLREFIWRSYSLNGG
jgi:hypothetical protein